MRFTLQLDWTGEWQELSKMTFSKQIYPTLHVGPLLIRHLITDGKNGEKKRKIKANTKFSFFGENFCDSSFPNRKKLSHLLWLLSLAICYMPETWPKKVFQPWFQLNKLTSRLGKLFPWACSAFCYSIKMQQNKSFLWFFLKAVQLFGTFCCACLYAMWNLHAILHMHEKRVEKLRKAKKKIKRTLKIYKMLSEPQNGGWNGGNGKWGIERWNQIERKTGNYANACN